ncbi:MAG: Y-family DNA polymerase, partial [Cytophagaceae bacterium]|nr:Y-family DNA polymerase [Cytophagaceae bacterium]
MAQWFALVDCNNFYCSCEQTFDPSAVGRPVVVLSNNDGNVISRSAEAKALGIKMGAPTFSVRELMAEHNIKMYSSNYTLYGDMSARVMNSLAELCPVVEVYSIDEAFVDLSIFPVGELVPFAQNVRHLVRKWTKIPTCVGIAPTKTLAKIANKLAKKEAVHNGVFAITDEATRREVLGRFDIADVWGIGHQHQKRMHTEGVKTALDLAEKPDWWVKGVFGTVVADRMVRELRGEACIGMLEPGATSKNICCSRSFGLHLNTVELVS